MPNNTQFNEQRLSPSFAPNSPKIIRWTIKYSGGLIKREKEAFYLVLTIITIFMIVSFYLLFGILSGPNIPKEALEEPARGYIPPENQY